ncbi:neprilysin-2-like [Amblyomma americanum]
MPVSLRIAESVGDVDDRFFLSWVRARRAKVLRLLRDQHSLITHSLEVNAYYYAHRNEIVIQPVYMQPTIFFPHGPASVNYGALGTTIGHEIMHGYDIRGFHIDDNGRWRSWGNNETSRRYEENTLCIRKSHEEVDYQRRQVNDELDSENLADFVGLVAAYAAFEALPENQRNVRPVGAAGVGTSPDQAFFVSYCANSCERDDHKFRGYATGRGRCLVPAINHPAFARAFNCSSGDRMHPAKKCSFF